MPKNFYEILNVSSTASQKEITAAYSALIKKYHPDYSDNANVALIAEINKAYTTLNDEEKRTAYDRLLSQKDYMSEQEFNERQQNNHYTRDDIKGGGASYFYRGGGNQDLNNELLNSIFRSFFSPATNSNDGFFNMYDASSRKMEDVSAKIELDFMFCCYGCPHYSLEYTYKVIYDDIQNNVKIQKENITFSIQAGIFNARKIVVNSYGNYYVSYQTRSDLIISIIPKINKNYMIDQMGNIIQKVKVRSDQVNSIIHLVVLNKKEVRMKCILGRNLIPSVKGVANKNSYYVEFHL